MSKKAGEPVSCGLLTKVLIDRNRVRRGHAMHQCWTIRLRNLPVSLPAWFHPSFVNERWINVAIRVGIGSHALNDLRELRQRSDLRTRQVERHQDGEISEAICERSSHVLLHRIGDERFAARAS